MALLSNGFDTASTAFGVLLTFITTILGVNQYKAKKRADEVRHRADETERLATANNEILQSWSKVAEELRVELGQCRKNEAELRIRMSGLETKLAMYRNVAQRGWPLEIVEGEGQNETTAPAPTTEEQG